jgi:hypothetical protein
MAVESLRNKRKQDLKIRKGINGHLEALILILLRFLPIFFNFAQVKSETTGWLSDSSMQEEKSDTERRKTDTSCMQKIELTGILELLGRRSSSAER